MNIWWSILHHYCLKENNTTPDFRAISMFTNAIESIWSSTLCFENFMEIRSVIRCLVWRLFWEQMKSCRDRFVMLESWCHKRHLPYTLWLWVYLDFYCRIKERKFLHLAYLQNSSTCNNMMLKQHSNSALMLYLIMFCLCYCNVLFFF